MFLGTHQCVQEEKRLIVEQGEKVFFILPDSKKKNNAKNKGKGKTQPKANIKKESTCFFCKKKGQMKKDCAKKRKEGTFLFVCYKSNFTNVHHNTWWIDSSSTIHVSNILQGMRNPQEAGGQ